MGTYGLHASDKIYDALEPLPAVSEMNLSTEPSSLKVEKFSRFTATDREIKLFASLDLVRFSHPETDSFLSCSCNIEKEVRARELWSDKLRKCVLGAARTVSVDTSFRKFIISDTSSCSSHFSSQFQKPPYLRKNLETITHDESAKSMWVIEHLDFSSASAIVWGSEVRIRHAITNQYLAVSPVFTTRRRASSFVGGRSESPSLASNPNHEVLHDCEMVDSRSLKKSSVFRLVPTDSQADEVPKKFVSFRLEHVDPATNEVLHVTSKAKTKYEGTPLFQQKSLDIKFSTHKGDNDAFILMPFERDHVVSKMNEVRHSESRFKTIDG